MPFPAFQASDAVSGPTAAIRSARRSLLSLSAVAVAGVVLAAAVGLVALSWTYRALQAADHAAGALRLHADVDQMHDAIRGDVLSGASGRADAQGDLERHVRQLERNLGRLDALVLPAALEASTNSQAQALRAYAAAALRALRHPNATELADFTTRWRELEQPLDATSSQLRALAAQAEESGRLAFQQGLGLMASSLLLITAVLVLASRRIAHSVLETHRQLTEATDSARRAGQSRADFLAAMSHEIRTPMTGVLGMVDLLAAEDLAPKAKGYVESLRTSGRHLLNVINDILDFTRIESGKLELERIDFSLPEVLERLRSLVHPLASERGLALDLRLAPHSPPVLRGDPTRIQQVLLNLTSNAIKFTERGGVTVTVAAQDTGAQPLRYRFEVRDTGVGIPRDRLGGLFAAFRQADESIARRYGGSGLGLAISKRLVEAMGGQIGAESTPGAGSLFYFELPLAAGDPGKLTVRGSAQRAAVTPRRILVAEDVDVNRQILQATLQRAGHRLVFARDGAEAVTLALREAFDLVLMDVQMPVMDGIEATRRIRAQDGPNRHAPILALTANVMAQERDRYLAAGMDECLTKPIDWDQLYGAIARHTESQAGPAEASAPALAARPANLLDDAVLDALERMAGREQVADWLRQGLASYAQSLRAMADPAAVATEAHKMRGSSGTLGLARLHELARRIEASAAAGDVAPAALQALSRAVADSESALRGRGLI